MEKVCLIISGGKFVMLPPELLRADFAGTGDGSVSP